MTKENKFTTKENKFTTTAGGYEVKDQIWSVTRRDDGYDLERVTGRHADVTHTVRVEASGSSPKLTASFQVAGPCSRTSDMYALAEAHAFAAHACDLVADLADEDPLTLRISVSSLADLGGTRHVVTVLGQGASLTAIAFGAELADQIHTY